MPSRVPCQQGRGARPWAFPPVSGPPIHDKAGQWTGKFTKMHVQPATATILCSPHVHHPPIQEKRNRSTCKSADGELRRTERQCHQPPCDIAKRRCISSCQGELAPGVFQLLICTQLLFIYQGHARGKSRVGLPSRGFYHCKRTLIDG